MELVITSGFPQIDLGIVADIQAAGFSFYFGVASNEGMGKYDVIEIGKGADDRVLYNGVVDPGLFSNGDVGADDGVTDVTAGGDTDGLDDNGVLELVIRSNGTAEFLQEFGIGFQECLFFAAIEPVGDLEGAEFYVVADHAFDGVGEVVLSVAGHMIADIVLQTVEEDGRFPDTVDAHEGHIRLGDLGFFHHPLDAAVVFQFGNAKVPGVIDSFDTQQGMGLTQDIFYVVFADGVAQDDKYLILADDAAGEQYGMANALAFVLNDKMGCQLGIFLFDKVLYLLPEIAYDEDKFCDTGFHQLVNYNREDGFSR